MSGPPDPWDPVAGRKSVGEGRRGAKSRMGVEGRADSLATEEFHAATALERIGWGVGQVPWSSAHGAVSHGHPGEEEDHLGSFRRQNRPMTAAPGGWRGAGGEDGSVGPSMSPTGGPRQGPHAKQPRPSTAPAGPRSRRVQSVESRARQSVAARLGHLPAALATAHARQVLLGGSVEGAKFESEAKRRGRISSSLKGSTEHRGSPQPMYAEEMFRPQSSSVTQQLFFQSRSRPHSAHPGTGGRMVTSWADAAAEADADAERVAIQRQLLRVAGPIDLQSAEHKQIADTAVWAAEEGKMRGTMMHWEATLEKSPNIAVYAGPVAKLERALLNLQGRKPEIVGKIVEICKLLIVVGPPKNEQDGSRFDRFLALCTSEGMHQRLECPTAETLEILLTHVAPDLGSDQQFKVLPKPGAASDPRLTVLAFLLFLFKFIENPALMMSDSQRGQMTALSAMACCWKFLRSDTVPHPDYGWLAMVQMDAMLTKWLGATDHAVEASVFARGACDVLASIVKRLLQLHPVLHESRAYTSLRQHLVQMFSRGEMERRNWSKLICRNIGKMMSVLPVPLAQLDKSGQRGPLTPGDKLRGSQSFALDAKGSPRHPRLACTSSPEARARPRSARGRLLEGVEVEDAASVAVRKSGILLGQLPDFLTAAIPTDEGAHVNRSGKEAPAVAGVGAGATGAPKPTRTALVSQVSVAAHRVQRSRQDSVGSVASNTQGRAHRMVVAGHVAGTAWRMSMTRGPRDPGAGAPGTPRAVSLAHSHSQSLQRSAGEVGEGAAGAWSASASKARATALWSQAEHAVAGSGVGPMGSGGTEGVVPRSLARAVTAKEQTVAEAVAAATRRAREVRDAREAREVEKERERERGKARVSRMLLTGAGVGVEVEIMPSRQIRRPRPASVALKSSARVSAMVLRPEDFFGEGEDMMAEEHEQMELHRLARTRRNYFITEAMQGNEMALRLFDGKVGWNPDGVLAQRRRRLARVQQSAQTGKGGM